MRLMARIALAAVIAATAGCVTRFPPAASSMRPCNVADRAGGTLYFVSSRAVDCLTPQAAPMMTNARAETPHYGNFRADGAATLATETAWTEALGAAAQGGRVVLYIHGYNNDFAATAERAALVQAASDGGTPLVLYAWPSHNKTLKYMWDENDAAWAQADADALLARLTGMADSVTLVAHSMGTRLAVSALLRLQERDVVAAARVDRLVLASPDFDRAALTRYAAKELLTNDRQVTLYVSRLDRALQTSFRLHGYARAGDPSCAFDWRRRPDATGKLALCYWPSGASGPWPDVVDLSNVSSKQLSLGHADFVESQGGYADLCHVLKGEPPTNRPNPKPGTRIWVLPEVPTPGKPHC